MKDSIQAELLKRPPMHAEGNICIDITDPLTGRVVDRQKGKNTVFPISLWGTQSSGTWGSYIDNVYTVLTGSTADIDPNFPFILGTPIGFGIPSSGGSGNYRGAYNAANQVLHASTLSSLRWKFQYDFTTAQANGTIGTIGLTHQYDFGGRTSMYNFYGPSFTSNYLGTSDGSCSYGGTYPNTGLITKRNAYTGTTTTIDISALVTGGSSTCISAVYDVTNGKYGVMRHYPGSTTYKHLYIFTDNTFTSIAETYTVSSVIPKLSYGSYACYIYGDYLFIPSSNTIMIFNYKTDTYVTTLTNNGFNLGGGISFTGYVGSGSLAKGKYLFWGLLDNSDSGTYYIIFDMSTQQFVGQGTKQGSRYNTNVNLAWDCFHPDTYLPALIYSSGSLSLASGAYAAKKLDTPVTKTSANGMTVTYELEVFY